MKANILHKGQTCIYCIKNLVNNKVYIGKTKCVYKRIHAHLSAFKNKSLSKINPYLFKAFKKYKLNNFEYSVLEILPYKEEILSRRELYWMDYFDSCNRDKGYNLRRDSSTKMIVHNDTRKKISKRLKKEWKSGIRVNHGKKLSKNWRNNTIRKKNQSKLFSNTLTKYKYKVINKGHIKIVDYTGLVKLGLRNAMCSFFRTKLNTVNCKNCVVSRIII